MQKFWQICDPNPQLQKQFTDALSIHPIIAQVLINRGIISLESAKHFLSEDLSGIHDPFLLKDMPKAIERIRQAQANQEKVVIFGDYDVDGVTSSILLTNLLKKLNIEVVHYIPHRLKDGYGLNDDVGPFAKEHGATLIITVDCGITAHQEVERINALGIDVVILDHHEPSNELPKAFAIVNPKRHDCPYPFKELASVGLISKLHHALLGKFNDEILDFVALGTIADVVPLIGENRTLVKRGLPRINQTNNKGLLALLQIAKIQDKKMKPYYVGFILAPRINATGRMDSAHKSLDLFLTEDMQQAYALAKVLDQHNTDRQKKQKDVVEEALEIIEQEVNFKDQKVIVLSKEGWHKGVLGIVAAKLTERFYRPSIVISVEDGVGTASARSIDGFHLYEALSSCTQCLEGFGGHEGAAGLRIKEENIDQFRNLINQVADQTLEIKKLKPIITIDSRVSLSDIDLKLAQAIEALEPFGEGNAEPVFCSQGVTVKSHPALLGKETLKFWVTDGNSTFSAVGFGMAKYQGMIKPGEKIDLAYQITIDDWNKSPIPQLKLKDICPSESE